VERHGTYIEFVSEPGFDLIAQSLEAARSGIRLQNIHKRGEGDSEQTFATVFVPNGKRGHFLRKINSYSTEFTRRNKPKNYNLINSISDIRLAVLESFWNPEERSLIPDGSRKWVEVWLSSDREQEIARFESLLKEQQIESADGFLKFPERAVKLIQANREQLSQLIETSDFIAEFRLAKEVASFYIELNNRDQVQIVRELLSRCSFEDTEVAVCILDSGINNGHSLIQPVLADDDRHTINPEWGVSDHDGHGTLMAGTAAYGDILELLNGGGPIRVSHVLESAKILPPPPDLNPKRLWGLLTAQGISRAEIQQPRRKRIVCLAVTATDDRDRGRPSSWSGAIDEMAAGYSDNNPRLIIVSAGNVNDPDNWRNYPTDNLTNQVHDPGQSWNALTVGAFTQKSRITDRTLSDYAPVAPPGGLSPYSTTSFSWLQRKWPIKPEVLFEGGNVARGPNDSIFDCEDLKLVSTYHDPQVAQFAPFCATSAASAQASWMAAQIQAQYPDAWPEAIRGLVVHSAKWTTAMMRQFLQHKSKTGYARLLRICGYGKPDLDHAIHCTQNTLTLISQATIQPFDRRDGRYITRDMHLYNLPWPTTVLSDLGSLPVSMRVTVSYFIEPAPGEIGWDNRYRYASHSLRFDVNGPGELENDFVRRVNNQARDDGEHPGTEGPGQNWVIGEARNVGSIHSDIWQGTAIELAASNMIAVYPAVGWWRERHNQNRWEKTCRYALIVSIQVPEVNVDIYTPVAVQVRVPIQIPIR
jgi:hypothetical protein